MEKLSGAAPLPPKELSLFKRIVKYYDQKQYKTGLKFANQILSNPKFAEHGETLSMKGILLNCLGKKEEARDFVKRGLRSNIQSFVCWHIYGLIMKSDRKYDEAIRCYIQALKLDKNNLQVLRDLSVLQIHTRDIDGCLETRNKLLTQRPNQKASWVGYAVVQHLRGNYDAAATIIYEFLKVQTSVEPYNYEHSELLIYYITILSESGRYEEAINFMESHAKEIVDKVSYLEIHADILLKLERFDDAEKDVWLLFERNPDCKPYYELLYQIYEARSKCELEPSVKRQLLEKCVKQFSSARLPKLLFLETLNGDEFIFHVDEFLRNNLRKGVPTLFVQVRRFYNSDEKRNILETLFLTYRKNLDDHATLGPVAYGNLGPTSSTDELIEPPSTLLWLNYLLAQHYNYMGQTQKALDVVSEELKRNPTIVDLYVLKAEIYRDAGDVITACRWMDEAQSLDTADRFLNAQCTKLMIQANRIEDADQMASKFTRGSTTATQYLTEMQCMWFLIENARSYRAMQKYGEALKLCHEIDRAYSTILEDQLDFHSYCLRKGTLRSYVETIRLEDRLRDHPAYFDAASLAIEIYLYLHANPLGDEPDESNQPNANLSSSELKKLRNKQRRAERRAEANREEDKKKELQQNQQHRNREKAEDPENRPPEVEELVPRKLARPADALTEAARFLQPLIDLSGSRIETHCLAYEIYERKGKYLLMTRSIRRGLAMPEARDHPWFNECVCRFLSQMAQLNRKPDNLVQDVLMEEARAAFGVDADLPSAIEYNDSFIKRNSKSFLHVFRGTLTKAVIDPKSSLDHLKKLPSPSCPDFGEVSWQTLLEALKLLRTYSSLKLAPVTPELIEKHRAECSALYPLAAVFFSDADLAEHRKAVMAELSDTSPAGGSAPVPNSGDVNALTEKLDSVSLHNSGSTKQEKATPLANGHVATGKKSSRNKRKKEVNSGQNPAAVAVARA